MRSKIRRVVTGATTLATLTLLAPAALGAAPLGAPSAASASAAAAQPASVTRTQPGAVPASSSRTASTPRATHPGQPATADPRQAKYYYNTWHTATGWCDLYGPAVCGVLYAGRNYFYHQCPGAYWEYQGYHNTWWAYTDLDSPPGARGWVSAVYFTVGGQDEPIPGLPRGNC